METTASRALTQSPPAGAAHSPPAAAAVEAHLPRAAAVAAAAEAARSLMTVTARSLMAAVAAVEGQAETLNVRLKGLWLQVSLQRADQ